MSGEPETLTPPWAYYRRTGLSEMRPYVPGEDLKGISVSTPDQFTLHEAAEQGADPGGYIARNPDNHADQWYVNQEYFEGDLEPITERDEAAELREENKRLSALVDELLLAPNPLDDENIRLRTEAAELRAAVMGWAKATKRAHEVYSSWVLGRWNEEGEFVYTTGDVVLAQKAKEEAEEYLYTLAATEASES